MKLVYPAIFTPLEQQEGFCVKVPDLKGCVTQGDDLANAIEMAIDAASGWVLDELEDGNVPPSPTEIKQIQLNQNEFISLIMLDMDSYAEKYSDKAVRKNCTIPAWMNTMAEKRNLNFSESLQHDLMQQLDV